MSIVRLRPTKLIVGHRSKLIVLEQATTAVVSHQNIYLAVRTKTQDSAVMVSAQRLGPGSLVSVQFNEIAIEGEADAVPDVAIDAISQQRNICEVRGINASAALSPVKIDKAIDEEIWMQGYP